MNLRHIDKHIKRQQRVIIDRLFPDICTIIPSVGDAPQVSPTGILVAATASAAPRLWSDPRTGADTTDIPCRFTIERAFVPDRLVAQTTVVSRFTLEIPVMEILSTDHIIRTVNGRVRKYEIRKIADISEWDTTIEMSVVELGVDYDG